MSGRVTYTPVGRHPAKRTLGRLLAKVQGARGGRATARFSMASCVFLTLAACDSEEMSRNLAPPPKIAVDQAAELFPDYAIDARADRSIALFLAENCGTLSYNAARAVSESFRISDRLEEDGFSREYLDELPDDIWTEIDTKVGARVQQKYRQMGMTSRGQSCATGRGQISQGTFLGSLLMDDRNLS